MKIRKCIKAFLFAFILFFAGNTYATSNIDTTYMTDGSTSNITELSAGEVFVDKSVSSKTVVIDDNSFTSNDYIVQLSAISKQCVESKKPVDVVFVLDVTMSTANPYYGRTISSSYNGLMDDMVMTLNECIDDILSANENNRVEIMAYGGLKSYRNGIQVGIGCVEEFLPLAHYENNDWTSDEAYVIERAGYGSIEDGKYYGGEVIKGKYISMIESAYSLEYAYDSESAGALDNISDVITRKATRADIIFGSMGGGYTFRLETNENMQNLDSNFSQKKVYCGFNGTYTQIGIANGAKVLMEQSDTSHSQCLILLTDGAANVYSKANNYEYATDELSESELVMSSSVDTSILTTATAVYWKEQLNKKYSDVTFYNVAVSVNDEMTTAFLNPEALDDTYSDEKAISYVSKVKELFNAGSTTLTTGITITNKTGTSDYKYATYSYAEDKNDLADIVAELLKTINTNACSDITIIDNIGDYMKVKEVLGIVKDGKLYNVSSTEKSGTKTVYSFEKLTDFTLEIDGNEVYCVIPEKYNTSLIRVVFTVGLKDEIDLTNSSIVKEIIQNGNYDTSTGNLVFYTNKWNALGTSCTVATFTLSENNKYYDNITSLEVQKTTENNKTNTYANSSYLLKDGDNVTVTLGNNGKQEVKITTSVTVKEEWNDEEDKYSLRPDEIKIKLLQGDKEYGTYILEDSEDWTKTIDDLPKYDASGDEYVYSVKEDEIVINSCDKYTFSVNGTTVTNTLVRDVTSVVVKYVDTDGNELINSETLNGYVGDDYTIDQKEIEGYSFKEAIGETSRKFIAEKIEVTYYYEKKKGTITVNLVDTEGNVIGETVVSEEYVGDGYYFEAPEIAGYKIVENAKIEAEYIDGKLVYSVVYEKEETPDTSDMNIALILAIFTVSLVTLKKLSIDNK